MMSIQMKKFYTMIFKLRGQTIVIFDLCSEGDPMERAKKIASRLDIDMFRLIGHSVKGFKS